MARWYLEGWSRRQNRGYARMQSIAPLRFCRAKPRPERSWTPAARLRAAESQWCDRLHPGIATILPTRPAFQVPACHGHGPLFPRSRTAGVPKASQTPPIRFRSLSESTGTKAVPALPSFLYFPTESEIESAAFDLPWEHRPSAIAGIAARDHGTLVPGRLVSSAKSWLCQDAVDRTTEILPREAEPPESMISPVEASARYLMHLRNAWNHAISAEEGSAPEVCFENQQIVLTVPASFDEEARELTVEAARRAGLEHLTLLEEPLAAFYAWVATHRQTIATEVQDGDLVLICDIGGGTSDFSLVRAHVTGSDVQFERTAVGDHLLLGGENLDLALARRVEQRLNTRLSLRQRHALGSACRAAKEGLLGETNIDDLPISILGSGRAVVGQMLQSELTRDAVPVSYTH